MPVEPDSQEAAADQVSTRVQAFRQQVEDARDQNPTAAAAAAAKAEEELLAQEIEVNPIYVHDWTVEDVTSWLGAVDLGHCANFFRDNMITGGAPRASSPSEHNIA